VSRISTIICPKCGTETDFSDFKHQDNPQCQICGKILLAEALEAKQKMGKSTSLPKTLERKSRSSREMGRSLNNLGDDDLFGDLEPFDLEGDNPPDDDLLPNQPSKATSSLQSNSGDSKEKKFKNPMESSKLMKKLKEDQDLFGSLD